MPRLLPQGPPHRRPAESSRHGHSACSPLEVVTSELLRPVRRPQPDADYGARLPLCTRYVSWAGAPSISAKNATRRSRPVTGWCLVGLGRRAGDSLDNSAWSAGRRCVCRCGTACAVRSATVTTGLRCLARVLGRRFDPSATFTPDNGEEYDGP